MVYSPAGTTAVPGEPDLLRKRASRRGQHAAASDIILRPKHPELGLHAPSHGQGE